jgi:hypothetical protein
MHLGGPAGGAEPEVREVGIAELRAGQILASAMETAAGALVLPKGTPLTFSHLEKTQNYARLAGIREPIQVFEIA